MSADNFIAVQCRGRKYHVWMAFASSPEPHIPYGYNHGTFADRICAELYARMLEESCAIVEYGITHFDDIGILTNIWQGVAAQRYWFVHWYLTVRNWYRRGK